MIDPNRVGGLMGVTNEQNLEYLREFPFAQEVVFIHTSEDCCTILEHGRAIVLTSTGWFLEDTSGG